MDSKILIAMSGGVDSSVCALLLKEEGYDCVGATMRLFAADDPTIHATAPCADPAQAEDAARIAAQLGIPFEVLDYSRLFRQNVIDYFVDTYLAGGTPNPCVQCNKTMKFGMLLDAAAKLGCDAIATGHYAVITKSESGRYLLQTATDPAKDQTYVLWQLTQEQLARTRFPLGGMTKAEVRAIAEAHGFCNAGRKDSQDICFIPDGNYAAFIARYTQKSFSPGSFLDLDGNVLGQHNGAIRYTVGQRKGLGIALGKPAYVCKKDMLANTVTLGTNEDLFSHTLTAHGINLIAVDALPSPTRVLAKIRYQAAPALAWAEQTDKDTLVLRFDRAQRAITSGQSVVLYDAESAKVVIGGGIID